MVIHKNDMTHWDEITCQRNCDEHVSRVVDIDLGQTHGYRDLPAIPTRLARQLRMHIWDPEKHPVDGGPYCPAHDAVSETIISHRTWEPSETIIALTICENAGPMQVMLDFGAQLGWFSLLAASCGVRTMAIDADAENLRLLQASAEENGWDTLITPVHQRIGPGNWELDGHPVRFAKIDVEGAEQDVIRILWPMLEKGAVDHLLIECSPVFADYYGDLVVDLIEVGYNAWRLPEKKRPPGRLDGLNRGLRSFAIHDPVTDEIVCTGGSLAAVRNEVNNLHQENFLFSRAGASW